MKKLAIFGIAVLLVAFGAGMALANPQVDGTEIEGGSSANAYNTVESGGSTGNTSAGVGDVTANGSTSLVDETKAFETKGSAVAQDGSNAYDTNTSTKTVTVDKSGQTNTDTDTKTIASNNTKTVTVDKSGQTNTDTDTKTIASGNALLSGNTKSEAEKNIAGAQNAGSGSATNTNDVDLLSGNTKTTTVTKNDTKTVGDIASGNTKTTTIDKSGQNNVGKAEAEKNIAGAQNAGVGNSATNTNTLLSNNTKDSNNTKTVGDIASGNTKTTTVTKVELDQEVKYGSAGSYSGDATVNKDSGNTKTVTIDKSGQTNKHNNANGNYGSAVAQDGSTATNTYSKTVTVDKSGQTNDSNNTKTIASNNNLFSGNTKTFTKDSNNTKTVTIDNSGQTSYKVDNQVMEACITGISNTDPSCCPTPEITQTVNKNWTAQNNGSFSNINGVINNNNTAGNFNSSVAGTTFTLNGGVANTTP
jgi:hypothetical protein